MRHLNVVGIAALTVSLLLSGCTFTSQRDSHESRPAVTCVEVLASVIHRSRTGDTKGTINSELDWLSRNCRTEYGIATDYFSMSVTAARSDPKSCASWREFGISPEAIGLLGEDGLCIEGAAGTPSELEWPQRGLSWELAGDHAGSSQRVCGPVASVRNTHDGAFVNVGRDYPDARRFTFIIWNMGLEPIPPNTTVCAVGNIYLYEGVAQMELQEPGQIEIWQ